MDTQLTLRELPDAPTRETRAAVRKGIRQPFLISAMMLAIYMFTVVAWSEASVQMAQFSKMAGFGLTYVFVLEFLLSRTGSVTFPIEFGVLLLFVLWNFFTLFWVSDLFWAVTAIKTLLQLLVFWLVAFNIMVCYRSIVPASIGLLAGLAWAIFSSIKANGMSFSQSTDARFGSVLTNANTYAIALTIGVLTCLYLYRFSSRAVRWILIALTVLAVHQIFFFSGSRKGMIGVFVAIGFYFAFTAILNGRDSAKQIFLLVLGTIAGYVLIDWLLANSPYAGRLFGIRQEPSFQARDNLMGFALDQWSHAPIVGHGANQFRVLHQNRFGINTYSHSNYFELMVNTGLIGLGIFYSFYALAMRGYLKKLQRDPTTIHIVAWALSLVTVLLTWDIALVSYDCKFTWLLFAQLVAQSHLLTRSTEPAGAQQAGRSGMTGASPPSLTRNL